MAKKTNTNDIAKAQTRNQNTKTWKINSNLKSENNKIKANSKHEYSSI